MLKLEQDLKAVEQDLKAVKQDVKAVDYKTTILLVIAADPNNTLRGIMAQLLDLSKPVAGA